MNNDNLNLHTVRPLKKHATTHWDSMCKPKPIAACKCSGIRKCAEDWRYLQAHSNFNLNLDSQVCQEPGVLKGFFRFTLTLQVMVGYVKDLPAKVCSAICTTMYHWMWNSQAHQRALRKALSSIYDFPMAMALEPWRTPAARSPVYWWDVWPVSLPTILSTVLHFLPCHIHQFHVRSHGAARFKRPVQLEQERFQKRIETAWNNSLQSQNKWSKEPKLGFHQNHEESVLLLLCLVLLSKKGNSKFNNEVRALSFLRLPLLSRRRRPRLLPWDRISNTFR